MEPEEILQNLSQRFDTLGGLPFIETPKVDVDHISNYTKLFMNDDGKSIHNEGKTDDQCGEIVYKVCRFNPEFKVEKDDSGKDKFYIKGWASTKDLDRDDEIIEPEAFRDSLNTFLSGAGRMLFMHDWWSLPVGKWISGEVRENGLWMEQGLISDTALGKDLQTLIQDGAINTLSVGFRIIEVIYNKETGVRTIKKLELLEISIVNIPANPNAIFDMAKSKNLKSLLPPNRSQEGPQKRKGIKMIDPELKKLIDDVSCWKSQQNAADDRMGALEKNLSSFNKTIKEIQEKAAAMNDPNQTVNLSDYVTFCGKTASDVTTLTEEIKAIKLANEAKDVTKYIVKDWRSLLNKGIHLRDDNGQALSPAHQKAYRVLNMPVDYDKSENGAMIKCARNLNDACLVLDSYYRGSKAANYGGIHTLEAFQKLAEIMEILDPELGASMKAMSTQVAGAGLEWIPTLFSGEYDSLVRLQPTITNFIRPAWQMPSATAKWPIIAAGATAYIAEEATVNNPKVLTKSNFTTAVVTFTARVIATAIPVSKQLLEDTLLDMVPILREELVFAQEDAEEGAIINGDNSAAHFDTGLNLTNDSDDTRVLWKGLRKLAVDLSNTWDSQSTTLGSKTTAFNATDVRYNRELLAVLGVDPSKVLHATSINGFFKALSFSEVTKANEFGFASTWLTGRLPALDGSEIYITSHMRDDMNASGIYDNSVKTTTGWLTLDRRGFMPGHKRATTLEFEYSAEVQQYLFIATNRRDFQNMRPTTQLPVAYMYNILTA